MMVCSCEASISLTWAFARIQTRICSSIGVGPAVLSAGRATRRSRMLVHAQRRQLTSRLMKTSSSLPLRAKARTLAEILQQQEALLRPSWNGRPQTPWLLLHLARRHHRWRTFPRRSKSLLSIRCYKRERSPTFNSLLRNWSIRTPHPMDRRRRLRLSRISRRTRMDRSSSPSSQTLTTRCWKRIRRGCAGRDFQESVRTAT